MRRLICRRSVSSLVSPGPRVPMPPPNCDMALPLPAQPRQQVLQLRQLHLQLALAGARVAGKNVQNQLRPVQHAAGQRRFQVAQLRRRKVVVKEHQIGLGRSGDAGNLLHFAGANQRRRIRPPAPLHHLGRHYAAGARHQLAKLGQGLFGVQLRRRTRSAATAARSNVRRAGKLSRLSSGRRIRGASRLPHAPPPRARHVWAARTAAPGADPKVQLQPAIRSLRGLLSGLPNRGRRGHRDRPRPAAATGGTRCASRPGC